MKYGVNSNYQIDLLHSGCTTIHEQVDVGDQRATLLGMSEDC